MFRHSGAQISSSTLTGSFRARTILAPALLLATAITASGCDPLGQPHALPDVSSVTVYIVHCDSVLDAHHCYGPTHAVSDEVFTVVISRQAVLRPLSLHQFSGCFVAAPLRWDCMDDQQRLVSMWGGELRWAELDSARQASVSKIEYFGFWRALVN